jgi:hypothetical protein
MKKVSETHACLVKAQTQRSFFLTFLIGPLTPVRIVHFCCVKLVLSLKGCAPHRIIIFNLYADEKATGKFYKYIKYKFAVVSSEISSRNTI